MKKIIQLITTMDVGGAQKVVLEYAKRLDRAKFKVTVISVYRSHSVYEEELIHSGVDFICLADKFAKVPCDIVRRLLLKISKLFLLKREIKRISPDIIHLHLPILHTFEKIGVDRSTKVYFTLHSEVSRWENTYPEEVTCLQRLTTMYDLTIIAINESMRELLQAEFSQARVELVYNGIDPEKFCVPTAEEKAFRKKELGIPEDCWIIGNTSRLHSVKNHEFVIDVFEVLSGRIRNTRLVLIGEGPRKDAIWELLNQKGLQEKVIWLKNRMDVENVLKAMDAFIMPSRSEGFPFALLEAQCVGIPVFASDVISPETQISNLVQFISLQKTPEEWADLIMNTEKVVPYYYENEKWDISSVIRTITEIYER